jgi:hypothetical protein
MLRANRRARGLAGRWRRQPFGTVLVFAAPRRIGARVGFAKMDGFGTPFAREADLGLGSGRRFNDGGIRRGTI